jgi:hypothetical protein
MAASNAPSDKEIKDAAALLNRNVLKMIAQIMQKHSEGVLMGCVEDRLERDKIEAELRRDAERYRHMRKTARFQDRNGPGLYWYLPRLDHDLPIGVRLDNSIDEAMREN